MIRIPASRGESTRIEVRSVDPSTNPYLALSVLLSSGLDGIISDLKVVKPIKKNLFKMSYRELRKNKIDSLPQNLFEALKEYKKSKLMKESIGENLFNKIIQAKEKEWEDYVSHVTEWEISKYLEIL